MESLVPTSSPIPSPPPPAGFVQRQAGWHDLDAVTSLLADASRTRIGAVTVRREDLRLRWLGLDDLGDTTLLHRAGTSTLTAYAAFESAFDASDRVAELHVDGQVHPRWTGHGLASHLLELAESRARSAARHHGADLAVVRTALVDGDDAARCWFASRRFVAVRHFLELRFDLHAPPPTPVWPDGVRCRRFVPDRDEERVWSVHQAAFDDVATAMPMTLDDFVHDRIGEPNDVDPELILIAETAKEVVGVAICRVGTEVAAEDGLIRDLGVLPGWRRRGVAMALLRAAFGAFRARGLTGVALEVDDVTLEGAAALYRRAGMRIARRTDVLERVLG